MSALALDIVQQLTVLCVSSGGRREVHGASLCTALNPSAPVQVVVSNVVATTSELRVFFRFHGEIKAVEYLNGDK